MEILYLIMGKMQPFDGLSLSFLFCDAEIVWAPFGSWKRPEKKRKEKGNVGYCLRKEYVVK